MPGSPPALGPVRAHVLCIILPFPHLLEKHKIVSIIRYIFGSRPAEA